MIPFFTSHLYSQAKLYVEQVLDSGMLSEGSEVEQFEREFELAYGLDVSSFFAVNSGTSALHLSLEVLERTGEEVILPANTFVATGMAILMAGYEPVFADILPDGTIDPEDVARKINGNTLAVMAVNWAGKRCRLEELRHICWGKGVYLITDAAQSVGVMPGGDITCYSFQAIKHVTTGDGGGLYFMEDFYYEKAKELRWFGISRKSKTGLLGEREYLLDRVGYKYHMNNLAASLGRANLWGYEAHGYEYYRKIASFYIDNLKGVEPVHKDTVYNAFWAFPIRVDSVSKFTTFCRARDIPCSVIHRGIDRNPLFGGFNLDLKKQRKWESTVTHLPVHMGMSMDDVEWIVNEVNKYE